MQKDKIINGFCFIKDDNVVFVDLITEKTEDYKKSYFDKFIKEYDLDEHYIVLANKENGIITMLFKYKLSTSKSNIPIKAKDKTIDNLINVCYKICIESFQKNKTSTI